MRTVARLCMASTRRRTTRNRTPAGAVFAERSESALLKVITVQPGHSQSIRLDERPEPLREAKALLVQAIALGVCGTDREIIDGP